MQTAISLQKFLSKLHSDRHKINEVMRILTVISVIMLPLTLISSIYGMNIPLPGQDDFRQESDAFWLIAVFMVVISVLMLWYFRKRHWL